MTKLAKVLKELEAALTITPEKMTRLAEDFQKEMIRGLEGKTSSLKMLSSYLHMPTGKETGQFLALDFGGTNGRLLLIELQGQGEIQILRQKSFLLKDFYYDYTKGTGEDLFSFLAEHIAEFINSIDKEQIYYLGHTFSFPFVSQGINRGVLLKWTKEFAVTGVEGEDVMALLDKALKKKQIDNIVLGAILNDTVGTQLTTGYKDPACRIGSIIGTGHNTSYLEQEVIINMESGNFNLLPRTPYDQELDENSENPGGQWLEKMVSGRYLGEIVTLIMKDLASQGLVEPMAKFSTKDISLVLAKGEVTPLQQVCQLVRNRSVHLIASTYLGILAHLPQKDKTTIAIDGSLFEKMPGYAGLLAKVLEQYKKGLRIVLTKDGSGQGAAIAAAVSRGQR